MSAPQPPIHYADKNNYFAVSLAEYITKKGMSISDFARASETSDTTIRALITGTANAKFTTIVKVYRYMNRRNEALMLQRWLNQSGISLTDCLVEYDNYQKLNKTNQCPRATDLSFGFVSIPNTSFEMENPDHEE